MRSQLARINAKAVRDLRARGALGYHAQFESSDTGREKPPSQVLDRSAVFDPS